MSATTESGIAVAPRLATVRLARSDAEERKRSSARTRMSTVRSERVMSVATSPWTLVRSTPATWVMVEAVGGEPVAVEPDLQLGMPALGR